MTSHIELTSKKDTQNAAFASMVLRIIRNTFDINLCRHQDNNNEWNANQEQ